MLADKPSQAAVRAADLLVLLLAAGFILAGVLLAPGAILGLKILPALALGLACAAAVRLVAGRLRAAGLPQPVSAWPLWSALVAGVLLRVGWPALVAPVHFSDFQVYWESALRLLQRGEYACLEDGYLLRAYRPPGPAFLAAAVMKIAGVHAWSPLLLNVLCYAAAAALIWKACESRLSRRGALAAVFLFALWPSGIMLAGLTQSEAPSIAGAALLVYLAAFRGKSLTRWALVTGLATGLLCLIRNSNLALVPVWIFGCLRHPAPWPARLRAAAVALVCTLLPILPWTVRNYRIFHQVVLVANNGGENLYSANYEGASGTWEDAPVARLRARLPDELAMDRLGYQLAKDWIRAHPAAFARLAVLKLRFLMSSDDYGAYYTLGRLPHPGPWLTLGRVLAGLWWLALLGLCLAALFYWRSWWMDADTVLVLAMAFVPALLFLVFQSQPRYHASMLPSLLYMAALALSRRYRFSANTAY